MDSKITIKDFKNLICSELNSIYPLNEILSIYSILLEQRLNISKVEVALYPEKEIPSYQLLEDLKRLKKAEPIQYILGVAPFRNLELKVTPDTLIPRPETEELVELILQDSALNKKDNLQILDIGTGSGCIAVTLAKETSNSNVVATDISEKALKIAQKNNEKLETNVKFLVGDLFEPVKNMSFDLIVSNPPYIPNGEAIGPTVIHEPEVALYGGNKGLDFYERIIRESKNYINPHGLIAFEHANNTKAELAELALKYYPNAKVTQFQDLSKRDRFTFIEVGEL